MTNQTITKEEVACKLDQLPQHGLVLCNLNEKHFLPMEGLG
jgi:hypothetical protein